MEITIAAAAARKMRPIGSMCNVIVRAGATRAKYTPKPTRRTRTAAFSGSDCVFITITIL
jgi:hypothetical protein